MCSECDELDRTITDADLAPFAGATSGLLRAATLARAVEIVRNKLPELSGTEMASRMNISKTSLYQALRGERPAQPRYFERMMLALYRLTVNPL